MEDDKLVDAIRKILFTENAVDKNDEHNESNEDSNSDTSDSEQISSEAKQWMAVYDAAKV